MSLFKNIEFNVQLRKETFCTYFLQIDDERFILTFPQLLQLRERVSKFTSPEKLTSIINNENFVLLFVADKKHVLFLEIPKLLDLKEELDYCFDSF